MGEECLLLLIFKDENNLYFFLIINIIKINICLGNNTEHHNEESNSLKSKLRQLFWIFVQSNAVISILLYVVQTSFSLSFILHKQNHIINAI